MSVSPYLLHGLTLAGVYLVTVSWSVWLKLARKIYGLVHQAFSA